MKKISQRHLGLIEGLIDGEGGFCIWTTPDKKRFHIEVAIHNTCLPLLKIIQKIIDNGSIRVHNRTKKHYKSCYTYKFTYKTLKQLLPQLKLVVKEEQRKIVIKALEWSEIRHFWGRWHPNIKIKYLTKAMNNIKKYNHE